MTVREIRFKFFFFNDTATTEIYTLSLHDALPIYIIPVMEINLRTLPEHYSDYFYESLLEELPEAFIIAEISGKIVGYIMCKMEHGFSNFKKFFC